MFLPKRLTMAALGLAALVFSGAAQAATVINFGVIPVGGAPSYVGASLDTSTGFNFGGGLYLVNQIGSGDQSTLVLTNLISLSNLSYGAGSVGSLLSDMVKSWTTAAGTFTETLTSFVANRATSNSLTLVLSGTLVGPGGISQSAFAILNANQSGGPGSAINWSLTNTSALSGVPLPAALPLFASGIAGLGFLALRRRKQQRA